VAPERNTGEAGRDVIAVGIALYQTGYIILSHPNPGLQRGVSPRGLLHRRCKKPSMHVNPNWPTPRANRRMPMPECMLWVLRCPLAKGLE